MLLDCYFDVLRDEVKVPYPFVTRLSFCFTVRYTAISERVIVKSQRMPGGCEVEHGLLPCVVYTCVCVGFGGYYNRFFSLPI